MTTKTKRAERRTDALSKARIVEAAIAILDADGEAALTFRALATHLVTGSGAIYWHVSDKNDLLAAAADDVIAGAMVLGAGQAEPRAAIRALALGIFDAIDAHPWVAGQLFREPWRPASLEIFEGVGRHLPTMGVPETARFDVASALVSYIAGAAAQNAANARVAREAARTDRSAFLADVAARWAKLDPATYPSVSRMAAELQDHDDRAQFLAGVDLILAGIEAASPRRP